MDHMVRNRFKNQQDCLGLVVIRLYYCQVGRTETPKLPPRKRGATVSQESLQRPHPWQVNSRKHMAAGLISSFGGASFDHGNIYGNVF